VKKKIKVSELQIVEGRLNRKYDSLRNFYEMKLREQREEINVLKMEVTLLSNMLWEIKKDLEHSREHQYSKSKLEDWLLEKD